VTSFGTLVLIVLAGLCGPLRLSLLVLAGLCGPLR
jgi:hypothetical protein